MGEHWVELVLTNSLGLTAQDSVLVTVLGNGTPFFGTPVQVPGRIEAENYDLGGPGVAYQDKDANNIGLAYRPDEGVDLEAADGGGFDVYWVVAGEWIEYTFEAAQAGTYTFTPYVATVPGFGNFTMSIDNVDVSGRRDVTSTGGWQFWTPIPVEGVVLDAGVHILRFDFDSDTDQNGWLFSLNYVDVVLTDVATGVAGDAVPGVLRLTQSYPNPFNPQTTISFALPQSGPVELSVFDVRGRHVATLADGEMPAGEHSLVWNGTDDAGRSVSSGTYVLRLQNADGLVTSKLTLLK